MPQTTTHVNACDVAIWLDDASGTPKDISGSSNQASIDLALTIGDLRTFGARWPRRLMCGKDATINLTAIYSTAADEAVDILKDWVFSSDPQPRTISIYIPDKNVGSDKYSGEVVVESMSIPVQAGEGTPIAVTAVLRPDGEFSLTTNAT